MKHIFDRTLAKTQLVTMVLQAIDIIRHESFDITEYEKPAYNGSTKKDFCTNGDLKTQQHYIEKITKFFPGFGIIGEENDLRIPCTIPGDEYIFIVDPVDGTKAYKRGQAHGIGTMIALVYNGEVIAAYVGNVNTGEVIGFGPDTNEVTHTRFGYNYTLGKEPEALLKNCYLTIGKSPWKYPAQLTGILENAVKEIHIMNGSIGTNMARLWTGETAAIVEEPAVAPWDHAPVYGIHKALGLVYLKFNPDTEKLEEYDPEMFYEVKPLAHPFQIITHRKYVEEIMESFNN